MQNCPPGNKGKVPSSVRLALSAGGVNTGARGSAWFYALSDDLSDQNKWSAPQEIEGSFAPWTNNDTPIGCPVYNGWYPTFMSLGHAQGILSTTGYVFYLSGSLGACDDPTVAPPPWTYTSRRFTIRKARR